MVPSEVFEIPTLPQLVVLPTDEEPPVALVPPSVELPPLDVPPLDAIEPPFVDVPSLDAVEPPLVDVPPPSVAPAVVEVESSIDEPLVPALAEVFEVEVPAVPPCSVSCLALLSESEQPAKFTTDNKQT
jgi:hypothetical protein